MGTATWTVDDLPDLSGKNIMVTGGTSGIGREVARQCLHRGAHVVLPSVTREEGDRTARELGGDVEVHAVDLGSVRSVRAFGESFDGDIDILFDNAGAMSKNRKETSDGFELHLGINFLGPFLLTELLAPRIRDRIVVTASMAHAAGHIDLDDPHFRRRDYSMAAAYAQSKLADMLWALDLDDRLRQEGSPVQVQIAHPGVAMTSILDPTPIAAVNAVLNPIGRAIMPTPADGARPLLYAATADLPPVSYVGPSGFKQIYGAPCAGLRSERANDRGLARHLREWAELQVGLDAWSVIAE